MRDQITANTCFGTATNVRARVDPLFAGLATRVDDVKRRCRTALQAKADAIESLTVATTVLQEA